jgi:hypothetical protein
MVMGPARLLPVSDCTANYRSVLSSGRAPYIKREKELVKQRKLKSGHGPQRGSEATTNWLTDRRSQYNLNLNL